MNAIANFMVVISRSWCILKADFDMILMMPILKAVNITEFLVP